MNILEDDFYKKHDFIDHFQKEYAMYGDISSAGGEWCHRWFAWWLQIIW